MATNLLIQVQCGWQVCESCQCRTSKHRWGDSEPYCGAFNEELDYDEPPHRLAKCIEAEKTAKEKP